MRISLAALAAAVIFLLPIAGVAQQTALHDIAPADEYFGRLQMSVLGIRNGLGTLSLRVDGDTSFGKNEMQGAESIEDAIRDWAQKYPHDNWLDRYAVGLEKLYAQMHTGESRMRLAAFAQWIHEHFAGQALDADCTGVVAQTFALPGDPTQVPNPIPTASP